MKENRLSFIKEVKERHPQGYKMALYACKCGSKKVCVISFVKRGKCRSCGCIGRELNKEKAKISKHGHARKSALTPEYYSWSAMKQRCSNYKHVKYKDYGGRGIKVCARWEKSFKNFINDMGLKPTKRHTIDRIDVNGNYEPKNCRWATPKQQRANQRNNNDLEAAAS